MPDSSPLFEAVSASRGSPRCAARNSPRKGGWKTAWPSQRPPTTKPARIFMKRKHAVRMEDHSLRLKELREPGVVVNPFVFPVVSIQTCGARRSGRAYQCESREPRDEAISELAHVEITPDQRFLNDNLPRPSLWERLSESTDYAAQSLRRDN